MSNKAIVSIGSNSDRTKNVRQTIEVLKKTYPDAEFSSPEITEPIALPEGTKPFMNLVGLIHTELSKDQFVEKLKEIEAFIGRNKEDEEEGIIAIDIDLLEWNDEILKPKDLIRPFIVNGLEELGEF